jgi:hypothetical protein
MNNVLQEVEFTSLPISPIIGDDNTMETCAIASEASHSPPSIVVEAQLVITNNSRSSTLGKVDGLVDCLGTWSFVFMVSMLSLLTCVYCSYQAIEAVAVIHGKNCAPTLPYSNFTDETWILSFTHGICNSEQSADAFDKCKYHVSGALAGTDGNVDNNGLGNVYGGRRRSLTHNTEGVDCKAYWSSCMNYYNSTKWENFDNKLSYGATNGFGHHPIQFRLRYPEDQQIVQSSRPDFLNGAKVLIDSLNQLQTAIILLWCATLAFIFDAILYLWLPYIWKCVAIPLGYSAIETLQAVRPTNIPPQENTSMALHAARDVLDSQSEETTMPAPQPITDAEDIEARAASDSLWKWLQLEKDVVHHFLTVTSVHEQQNLLFKLFSSLQIVSFILIYLSWAGATGTSQWSAQAWKSSVGNSYFAPCAFVTVKSERNASWVLLLLNSFFIFIMAIANIYSSLRKARRELFAKAVASRSPSELA